MKYRSLVAALAALFMLAVVLTSVVASHTDDRALIQISCRNRADLYLVQEAGVPIYARLAGGAEPRLLAGATPETIEWLRGEGLGVTVLDSDMREAHYYLVFARPDHSHPDWDRYGRVLLNEGAQALVRTSPEKAGLLAEAGTELKAITIDAKPPQPAQVADSVPNVTEPDPIIEEMVAQVASSTVYSYTGGLSGEWPVLIGSSPYTITTRHTESGEPIQRATQYAGQHLASRGLDVEYHTWGGSTYPNVVGELRGRTNPEDVYIICAHIDDMPLPPDLAPGADDNASGTTAVLVAADILAQYQWGRTLRFALWTGEELGLLGSGAYAQRAFADDESILGVINLDMIGWNTSGSSPDIDLHANSDLTPTLGFAQLFSDVVSLYGLSLVPEIKPSGTDRSDHASFWDFGYPAILGIEDFGDFNPGYHTPEDRLEYLDLDYYTDFVRASVATFAHMCNCLIPAGIGYLDGHVTSAGDSAPIANAVVSLTDRFGHSYRKTSSEDGYYTATLAVGTYTVTASAEGYGPSTASGAVIVTDTLTTRNFSLQPLPDIVVKPTVLTATLASGDIATHTLWITNTGMGDLTFALHELEPDSAVATPSSAGALPWLSETPEAATIGPSQGLPVAVTFDAGGLDALRTYLGLLDVASNDPMSPHVEISVSLTVEPFHFYLPIVSRGG